MAGREQLLVICYDVARDSLRAKISALLERHGVRVQYSVFECRMTVEAGNRLFSTLDLMRDEGDGVRMYVIPEDARKLARSGGGAPISEKSGFLLL